MATVLDIISGSLRLLGVLAQGEVPTAQEAQDALFALNAMMDTWKNESLMVYNISPQTFAMVGGQKTYTMGPGGDWDTQRPIRIDSIYLLYTDTTGTPLPLNLPVVLVNQDQYNQIIVPNTTTTIPQAAYVSDDFPLRQISLWPVPQVPYDLNVFTWGLIDGFASITDTVSLPPGYERLIRFNLALEIAPEYGRQPSQIVAAGALSSKASVKRSNAKPLYLSCDAAVVGRSGGFDYLTGV